VWSRLTLEVKANRGPMRGPPDGFVRRLRLVTPTAVSKDGRIAALEDTHGAVHLWDTATAILPD
jgi:hypothetical protein